MAQRTGSVQARSTNEGRHQHRTARVIEVVGTSRKSFEDAVASAMKDASATLRDIHGAHIIGQTVSWDGKRITEYKVDMKLAFGIERT